MREVSHPFASRIDTASAGGMMSPGRPRRPAIDSAAVTNHASYSRRASTTLTRRSLRACGPLKDRCGKPWRAVVVGVQDDQYCASRPAPTRRQVDIPLQVVRLEEAIALDPNGPWHMQDDIGNGSGYSPDQDRYGLHLAGSFHYRDDCRHWSGAAFEQVELAGS